MADGIQTYHDAELKEKIKFEQNNPGKKCDAKYESCEATIAFTRHINWMFDIPNSCDKDKSLPRLWCFSGIEPINEFCLHMLK